MSNAVPHWVPSPTITRREQMLLTRVGKHRRLFAFLHQVRRELFDDAFQSELAAMYSDTNGGKMPVPPALLAMATLMQAYMGVSDAEAVDLTVVDLRWQLVLDVLGAETAAFSQHTLQAFRERLIFHNMDQRLLERTIELAKKTKAFDWHKLPGTLRLAIDSRPLEGAGRVEDTFNLLGHAAFKLLRAAAALLQRTTHDIADCAQAPVFLAPSVKSGLDIDWFDPKQKKEAIGELLQQINALESWIRKQAGTAAEEPPLKELFETIAQLREQDLDPEPPGGKPRVREGVAKNRRISVEDGEMRHGRKSKSKRVNGYKQHIANDLDTDMIVACSITPANRPEGEGAVTLKQDISRYTERNQIGEVFIDRGYVNSNLVENENGPDPKVFCKPWNRPNQGLFTKSDFKIDIHLQTISCPAGQTKTFEFGEVVQFAKAICTSCPLRAQCTNAQENAGRTVWIAPDERMQQRLRTLVETKSGRGALRERVHVEHRLAHLARKQGPRARYRGLRKNLFDTRRYAAVLNLEVIQRQQCEVAKAA